MYDTARLPTSFFRCRSQALSPAIVARLTDWRRGRSFAIRHSPISNGEDMSVRKAIAVALLSAGIITSAAPAAASPPTRISESVDATFKSNRWTARCGFPVYIHEQGTINVLLFNSRDGIVISEIDTSPGYKTTYFSPLSVAGGTGGSFTSPAAVALRTTYPDGIDLGAPAILSFNGLQGLVPGSPQAGRDVYLGEVVFVTPEGQPFADLVAPISTNGHFDDFATFVAALCGALRNP
jgi:hypothetical protein